MARFYYLGPWVLDTKGAFPFHRAPLGTVGVVDLRRIDGGGVGFFTTEEPLTDSDYLAFGDDKGTRLDSVGMDDAKRSAFASLVGMRDTPTSATLLDLLWDALTIHSDPDGVAGPKPIMPTSRGTVDLHLAGHSRVRSARVPRDPTALPHWDKVQRVLQTGFREVAEVAARGDTQKQRDLHKRWLGFQQQKYGLTAEAATALIVPEDMPRTTPMKPETTINEAFTNSDGSPLGADLTWAEIDGDWICYGGKARTNSGSTHLAQAAHDLSGADHYAKAEVHAHNSDIGVVARAQGSAGAATGYLGITQASTTVSLYRINAGSYTSIEAGTGHTWANGEVLEVVADGADISVLIDGVVVIGPYTDTNIASGVRGGLWGYAADHGDLDNFEAADLGAAAPTRGAPFGSRGTAFNGGRAFMGILR